METCKSAIEGCNAAEAIRNAEVPSSPIPELMVAIPNTTERHISQMKGFKKRNNLIMVLIHASWNLPKGGRIHPGGKLILDGCP
ncbi:MAG: hypothetical protein ACD_34C00608G0002, partial [uncultured bacterium]